MAEPQKGSSSVINSKREKDSLLGDMDFGKDFFTSWNSMNMTGDDAMDFGFGTIAKGKQKAFSFDKLDVDFSLDGDLDKISSFKIDMSNLDISSPLKKSGTIEGSKEESGDGNHHRKQGRSSFQFDFDELDDFQFDPKFTKEGNKVSQDRDSEEASNKGECQGCRTEQGDIIGASDGLDSSLSASKGMTTSKVKTTFGDLGKFNCPDHSRSLDTRADDTSKPPTNQKSVKPAQEVILPEMISESHLKEIVQDAICQEERSFQKSYALEKPQDISVKSLCGNQEAQVTLPEIQVDVSTQVTEDSAGKKSSNRDSVASPELERLLLERQEKYVTKLCSDDSERNIYDNDSIPIGDNNGSEPAQDDVDSADTSSSNTSRKSTCDTESSGEHQNGKSEGRVPSLSSKMSRLIEMKEKETGSVRSKFLKRSAEIESQIQRRQSSQTAVAVFPPKLMGSKQQTERRREVAVSKDAQGGNKVVGTSDSASGDMTKRNVEPESVRTVRSLKDIRESLNTDGLLDGSKSAGSSRLSGEEITIEELSLKDRLNADSLLNGSKSAGSSRLSELAIGEPVGRLEKNGKTLRESLNADGLLNASKSAGSSRLGDKEIALGEPVRGLEKNAKNLVTLGSGLNSPTLIEQICKPTTQGHATTRTSLSTGSIKSSLNISGNKNKASTPKATNSLPDLSGLKISRVLGGSRPLNFAIHKQTNSSRNLKHANELEGSAPSNIPPSISKEKQSLSSPSLKRKTYEGSSMDTPNIKPLKRLSPSPTESRNIKELVEDAKKEVRNNVNIAKSHDTDCCRSPTLDVDLEVNLTDLKMPLVIESDDNVEKAEAYTKDLEDMCNMLKKKHEEAKELLVRAVVNNNNLLMLNHPIYEEKIHKIQKFAMQLMSK